MLETVIAVLIITSAFLALFKLSHMLTGKILLEHAAMRVARARTVGMNEFMCVKAARVATIPVSGKRLWPADDPDFDSDMELGRLRIYMLAKDQAVARGVLEYEGWDRLRVEPGDGTRVHVQQDYELFDGEVRYGLEGEAGLENNYTFYLNDQGR